MTARWYIVHAYSNFEKKVAEDIEAKAKQKGLSELIEQIVVPTEKIVEVRRAPSRSESASSFRATCWCAQPLRTPCSR
jgi:transcription antitermination factor NusG